MPSRVIGTALSKTGTIRRPAPWLAAAARIAVPVAVYVTATVVLTWPLAGAAEDHLIARGRSNEPDVFLVLWILSWCTHALVSAPASLFDGNVFHPTPEILARSEHLLGNQPIFAPVWLATENPVLAMNAVTFMSFVLSGLFMHLLIRRWTGSHWAAYVAGLAFAFAPWRMDLARVQYLSVQYFPLILLGLERILRAPSAWSVAGVALALTLQALCSYYLGYMAFIAAGIYCVVHLLARGLRRPLATWGSLLLALGLPIAMMLPVTLPYLGVDALTSDRPRPELWLEFTRILGSPTALLRTYGGWGTCALAAVGLGMGAWRWRRNQGNLVHLVSLALVIASGLALARGPLGVAGGLVVPFDWLSAVVPGFANNRHPVTFGILVALGLSGLAGFAVAYLTQRMNRSIWRGATAVMAGALVLLGTRGVHFAARPVPTGAEVPLVYRWLAENGEGAPLLELPIGLQRDSWSRRHAAARAMYFSTYHWLPTLNGHTGYPPASYAALERQAAALPDPAALRTLVACTGLRWILVHSAAPRQRQTWQATPGIRLWLDFSSADERRRGGDLLYEVLRPSASDCQLPMVEG